MKILLNLYKTLISESTKINTPNGKKIVRSIKNRRPISFYYSGPRKDVLSGRRIKVEPVALGLSKAGNMVVRAWAQPPSVSKKGFKKHGWRLFRLDRISDIILFDDEQFINKRPNYTEDDDGSMTVTYVKSEWDVIPDVNQVDTTPETREKEQELPDPEITSDTDELPEPKITPNTDELPEPTPEPIPSITPETTKNDRTQDISNLLSNKMISVENQKQINPDDLFSIIRQTYLMKLKDWKEGQKQLGLNMTPGEGTRRRFEKESEIDVDKVMKKDNIKLFSNDLQESIRRIKSLILF
jgi:hypothetical protein